MRSDDLAPLLARGDRPQIGMRQGVIVSFDPTDGSNAVEIGGQTFTDLPLLSAADSVMLSAGDQVALLRFESTYFILGAVRPAGLGSSRVQSARIDVEQTTTSTAFTDLATVGPEVSVHIGRSRQALVFISASCGSGDNEYAVVNFAVSGASTIAPDSSQSAFVGASGAAIGASSSTFVLLTEAQGLNRGLNTFTMKYKSQNGTLVEFSDRRIAVFPF